MSNQRITAHDATEAVKAQAFVLTELNERESAAALLRDFGITDFADTEPAELALVEIEPDHLRRQLARAAARSRYDELPIAGSAL